MKSLRERFWSKVDIRPGCWNWTGAKFQYGYGKLSIDGKLKRAHRISWFLTHGYWPDECVCHSCDNTSCVNPSHLFLGSQQDNVRDAVTKHRLAKSLNHVAANIIRWCASNGYEQRRIAEAYGISIATVSDIYTGRTWTHL